jgi:protein TonB
VVQLALGIALVSGLRVSFARAREAAQRLIEIGVPPPPIVPLRQSARPKAAKRRSEAAPAKAPAPQGGVPGPVAAPAPASVTPVVPLRPAMPVSGGGTGTGPAVGTGAGGGAGGEGRDTGDGGGTDLELISGEIHPRDYPKHLGNAGVGGRVTVIFSVGIDGRPRQCRVERSSGIRELDSLTCRLIEKRFRFRPSLDRFGRPVPEEVEWDHDWIVG